MAIRSRRTLDHRFLPHLARLADEPVQVVLAIGVERLLPVERRQPPREPRQLGMALGCIDAARPEPEGTGRGRGRTGQMISGSGRRRGEVG